MCCPVPREGIPRRFSVFFSLILLLLAFLVAAPCALAFTAHALGDVADVAVMDVSGNFNALDPYGQPNLEPRRAIAREFYRTHGDAYDFLVIFTNFPIQMPSPQARAFFAPAKNDVRGIGLELFDNSHLYSSDGASLERLQGTIDMANVHGHVLDPANPEFDDTLRTLTHELLHRWGAYLHFRDGDAESDALLGLDRAHWSFLLDSGGSTLYGNRWHDNGDGTFTMWPPEQGRAGEVIGRIFSPLELYLMGLVDKAQVPPLLLIDAPGIARDGLPEIGLTIPGMARMVTIDDIIAVEGERIPAAAQSRKELRVAFVYAVTPGSWSADDAADRGEVAAIDQLRQEWERRFAILTDGAGLMSTTLAVSEELPDNPPVDAADGQPATAPDVDKGVAWLVARQQTDGSWQDRPGSSLRDTAAAMTVLRRFGSNEAVRNGAGWLAMAVAGSHDELARQLTAGVDVAAPLLAGQNADGGWGASPGYGSTPLDTALALQALAGEGGCASGGAVAEAVTWLHGAQQADGGWSAGFGASLVQPTAQVLLALNACRSSYPLEPALADGLAWLSARQLADGGFGDDTGTVVDTALALQTVKAAGGAPSVAGRAQARLLARQADNGSWGNSVFQTAQVLTALHAAMVAPDLAVVAEEITLSPTMVTGVPAQVTLTATVRNLGREPVTQAVVALYSGTPEAGTLLGETSIDLPGGGSVPATFTVTVGEFGVYAYTVVVDGARQFAEGNEWNNRASRSLTVSLTPPTVGFAAGSSAGAEGISRPGLAVRLSHPWQEPVTVNCATVAAGTALPSADYLPLAGTLFFAAGQTEAFIDLTIIDDFIAEADKTVAVELTSSSGGTLGVAHHLYTILDNEVPGVTIDSPVSGVSGANTPLLRYTNTPAIVTVKLDGVIVSTVSGGTLGPLPNGVHTVEVTAVNGLGLTRTARVMFTVDTSRPVVTIAQPIAGALTGSTPLIVYTATLATRDEVRLDGAVVASRSGEALGPLVDGSHTVVVSVWNAAGVKSSSQVTFTVDTQPPAIVIDYPGNDFIREDSPRLLYQVDGGGQASVWLDGAAIQVQPGAPLGPLADGLHHLRVTASDAAGNRGAAEATFVVTAGTDPPFARVAGWPVAVSGAFGGSAVDAAGNVHVVTRKGEKEFLLAKFDPFGHLLWQVTTSSYYNIMGGAWVDIVPKDLAVDSKGNLYVVGWGQMGTSNYGLLAKFDADGRSRGYVLLDNGLLYGNVYVYSVCLDRADNVFVSGATNYGLFAGEHSVHATMFVAKYTSSLALVHGKSYGGLGNSENFYFAERESMAVDTAQNLYLAGYDSDSRLLVWKLNPDLTKSLVLTGSASTYGRGIDVDSFGNVYVAGQSPSGGALWKYSPTGQLLTFLDGASPLAASSVVANDDGSAFLLDYNGNVSKFTRELQRLWSVPAGGDHDARLMRDGAGQLVVAGTYAGGSISATITRLADPRDPTFTIDATVFTANRTAVTVSGEVTPGYLVTLETPGLTAAPCSFDPAAGKWQMTVAGVKEGSTVATFAVTNSAGIKRRLQATLVIDTQAPQVTITAPAHGSSWTTRPVLSYTVSEGTAQVFVNGVEATRRSGFPLDSLLAGENRLRVQSIDVAGHLGSAEITVYASGAAVGEIAPLLAPVARFGSSGEESVVDSGRDVAGNLYIFGETTGILLGCSGSGGQDLYVAKYAPGGQLLAHWQFGSVAADAAASLAVAPNGDFAVAYNTDLANAAGNAMVVARYRADGTLLWSDRLDSGAFDRIYAIEFDAAGNLLACGYVMGRLNNKRYGGAWDYFLIKYGTSGGRLWTVQSNAATYEFLADLEIDGDGSIYATGQMNDTHQMSLFKFAATGDLLWKRDYRYGDDSLSGQQLALGRDGSLYTLVESNYGSRFLVTKHDGHGNLLNETVIGSPAIKGLGMALDDHGDLYITGAVDDPYNQGWSLDGNLNFGDEDIFVVKLAGNDLRTLWSRQYGDAAGQQGVRMSFSAAGTATLIGITDGAFGGSGAGGTDLFVATLQPSTTLAVPILTVAGYPSPTRERNLTISGFASPGTTVEVAVTAPGGSPATLSPVAQRADGGWQFTIGNLVEQAENLLTVRARNPYGMVDRQVAITVDTLPPQLQVDPVAPATVNSQTLTGSVEPGAQLTVRRGQGAAQAVTTGDGRWSYTATWLVPGENQLTFTATDAAGNATSRTAIVTHLAPPPLSLTVTPAEVEADAAVNVILTIGNIVPPGSAVEVAQYFDLNGNCAIDEDDPVVRRFRVVDGVRTGNPNLPEDADALVDGVATVRLNGQQRNDLYHAAGRYFFLMHAAERQIRVPFTVREVIRAQSLSGTVRNWLGNAMPGVTVQLRDAWGYEHGYAVSDTTGSYRFEIAEPGEYLPVPEGYVWRRDAAATVTIAAGAAVQKDLVIEPGPRGVYGMMQDAATGQRLAGVTVRAENSTWQASAMTFTDGSYALRLADGDYRLWAEARPGDGLAAHGLVAGSGAQRIIQISGSLSGQDLLATRGDRLVCGTVSFADGRGVAGAPIRAIAGDGSGALAGAVSDGQGRYCLALSAADPWQISLRDEMAQGLGLIGNLGSAASPDLRVYPVDSHLSGTVRDTGGAPVAGVEVEVGHAGGAGVAGVTDATGRYRFGLSGAAGGEWRLLVHGEDLGFVPAVPVLFTIFSGDAISRDVVLQRPGTVNTITVTRASYDARKKVLTVEATSDNADARLQVNGIGPMSYLKVLRGKYYWTLVKSLAVKPVAVTVSGPEGSRTVAVQ